LASKICQQIILQKKYSLFIFTRPIDVRMSARGTAKNARRAWENKTTLSTLTLLVSVHGW